jgi:hypothetical protein
MDPQTVSTRPRHCRLYLWVRVLGIAHRVAAFAMRTAAFVSGQLKLPRDRRPMLPPSRPPAKHSSLKLCGHQPVVSPPSVFCACCDSGSFYQFVFPLTPALITALGVGSSNNDTSAYFNLHTAAYPGGEIRGQLAGAWLYFKDSLRFMSCMGRTSFPPSPPLPSQGRSGCDLLQFQFALHDSAPMFGFQSANARCCVANDADLVTLPSIQPCPPSTPLRQRSS